MKRVDLFGVRPLRSERPAEPTAFGMLIPRVNAQGVDRNFVGFAMILLKAASLPATICRGVAVEPAKSFATGGYHSIGVSRKRVGSQVSNMTIGRAVVMAFSFGRSPR